MTPRSIRDFRIAASTLSAGSVGSAPVWQLTAVLRAAEDAAPRRYQAAGLRAAPIQVGLPSGTPGPFSIAVNHVAGIFTLAGTSVLRGLLTRSA